MSDTPTLPAAADETPEKRDFIRQIVREDLASGKHAAIKTRFPPEPNGYLHIGHAKSICLNFGLAGEFKGVCNLRFDDTNPAREDPEYVAAIQDDVRWLGFGWNELRHASDYFDAYYLAAEKLIRDGKAFVCDLSAEQVREYRGTLTEPGRNSPYRDRSVEENLDLFRRMRAGEFADGSRTLRARIDMASGNINLRDPALYRIKHVEHQNTGNAWPIYPMYDFAHALGDAVEGITHSLCTLEFEDHRPLYDWCVDNVDFSAHPDLLKPLLERGLPQEAAKPRQIEFSRLNINYTVMSKRKLMTLVTEQLVNGWDDPRMPTLQGLRRRGYTPAAMRLFVDRVGISKQNSLIDFSVLEGALREDLDAAAPRRMAVIDPLKLVLANLPENHDEMLVFSNHPKDESFGKREIPFSRELWIEREDFEEVPPKGFKRLIPGGEVRLRGAGIVRCDEVIKNDAGDIVELRGWLDPESRPGMQGAERKIKGTIHWVSAAHGVPAEIRLYDRLFVVPNPDDESEGRTYRDYLNPDSFRSVRGYVEPAAAVAAPETSFQFERNGYFVADRRDHDAGKPVFNRSVTLRDTWAGKGVSGMLYAQVHLTLPAWTHEAIDTSMAYAGDADKVALAIELSRRNVEANSGGPFGAVVFGPDDRVVAIGVNRVMPHTCSLAHAENMAYMLAQQRLQTPRLNDRMAPITLATSSQPCCQCYGATVWAGIDRLLIGARAEDVMELTEFDEGPLPADWIGELNKRGIEVVRDLNRDAAREVLRAYGEQGGDRY